MKCYTVTVSAVNIVLMVAAKSRDEAIHVATSNFHREMRSEQFAVNVELSKKAVQNWGNHCLVYTKDENLEITVAAALAMNEQAAQ